MNVVDWLADRFSNRGKALSLYRRGMAKAKKRDHRGAIEDYSKTLGMPDTPNDVKAMVLYNRALAYVATGDSPKGVDDLQAVLAMEEASVNVRTMTKQKLKRMESQPDGNE